eukprot:6419396-Pyramimonas_sp.AAC.1
MIYLSPQQDEPYKVTVTTASLAVQKGVAPWATSNKCKSMKLPPLSQSHDKDGPRAGRAQD